MATITCQDCGAERTQTPKNTRYCKPCRLLRDLAWWEDNRRSCLQCRASFAPIGRADLHCSACRPGIRGRNVDCVLHGAAGALLLTGIPVCADCLRSPKKRATLIAALERGQRQRRESNNATT